jgi:hypothetical protein
VSCTKCVKGDEGFTLQDVGDICDNCATENEAGVGAKDSDWISVNVSNRG